MKKNNQYPKKRKFKCVKCFYPINTNNIGCDRFMCGNCMAYYIKEGNVINCLSK